MGTTNVKPEVSLPQQMMKVRMAIKSTDRDMKKMEKNKQVKLKEAQDAQRLGDISKARQLSAHVVHIDGHMERVLGLKLYLENALMTCSLSNNVRATTETLSALVGELEALCSVDTMVGNFGDTNELVDRYATGLGVVHNDIERSKAPVDESVVDGLMTQLEDGAATDMSQALPDVGLLTMPLGVNNDPTVNVCTNDNGGEESFSVVVRHC